MSKRASGAQRRSRVEAVGMAAALVAGAVACWQHYRATLAPTHVLAGVRLANRDLGGHGEDAARLAVVGVGVQALSEPITLVAGDAELSTSPAVLGARPRVEDTVEGLLAAGRTGAVGHDVVARLAWASGRHAPLRLGFDFDESIALRALTELAPAVERPSLPTRLDLERRKVLPAERGQVLRVYDSLSAVAIGLAAGDPRVELTVHPKPPVPDPLAWASDDLEIGVVVGRFETRYHPSTGQGDRNHNLAVGAAAVDGTIVMPGESFSFNAVVGERSAEAGYRYATGISAGQLVDVLGGGICQVSSTLFGAAFFAGLEIVDARPHSRPSSYVDMGLDATVAWPDIDLELRNGFDFPVVFHMTVSSGKVRAEVLGARRPYRVAFERVLEEAEPFETRVRDDDGLAEGLEVVHQRGRRGFRLRRDRKFYRGEDLVRTESHPLRYPPTTEIVRRGTNPRGKVVPTKALEPLRDPEPQLRIVQ